jgi:hypothetical protein
MEFPVHTAYSLACVTVSVELLTAEGLQCGTNVHNYSFIYDYKIMSPDRKVLTSFHQAKFHNK